MRESAHDRFPTFRGQQHVLYRPAVSEDNMTSTSVNYIVRRFVGDYQLSTVQNIRDRYVRSQARPRPPQVGTLSAAVAT